MCDLVLALYYKRRLATRACCSICWLGRELAEAVQTYSTSCERAKGRARPNWSVDVILRLCTPSVTQHSPKLQTRLSNTVTLTTFNKSHAAQKSIRLLCMNGCILTMLHFHKLWLISFSCVQLLSILHSNNNHKNRLRFYCNVSTFELISCPS